MRVAATAVLALLALSACATTPGAPKSATRSGAAASWQVPPFARLQYEPFSRDAVVGVALREWRLFGQRVDDDPPGSRSPRPPEDKPERWPGLWQRVGEYWWIGLDPADREAAWTGKHDDNGVEFPPGEDGRYAWSAAFVSYVMRIAGAGPRFPYSGTHADYIDIARQMSLGQTANWVISAERPESYAPRPGDLICMGRGRWATLRYDDLPNGSFPAHCDIVVQTPGNELVVVGGNVDDAVTMKHVPVTPDGKLADPSGVVLDQRYPWMVVLRVLATGPIS